MTSNKGFAAKKQQKNGFGASVNSQKASTGKLKKGSTAGDEKLKKLAELVREGNITDAKLLCNRLIQSDPDDHKLHSQLGDLLRAQGNLAAAIDSYKKGAEINPNPSEDFCNIGDLLKQLGDTSASKLYYSNAIKADKHCLRAHYNLGVAYKETRDFDKALTEFKLVAQNKPDLAEAHISIGAILHEQGQHASAIESLQLALHYQPHSAQALNNLGLALGGIHDFQSAVHALQSAVRVNPKFAEAHNNLGLALQKTGQLREAITSFKKALSLGNNLTEAHNNLGLALQEDGDIYNAMASFKNALQLNPNLLEVRCNLSMLELLMGDYKQGLDNYEFRFSTKTGHSELLKPPHLPRWSGKQQAKGQNLLLISEQGLGDTLHFMRYVEVLRKQGVAVTLCAQKKLHELIKASDIDQSPLTYEEAAESKHGEWMPLLSLPKYLEVRPDHPIINDPYIKAPDSLIKKWEKQLSSERRPIIGINWQGNPDHEKSTSAGRSLPLETFSPIAELQDITLLSLQKGFGSEQIDQCSFRDRFVQCQNQINETWSFLETAAIIANCDVVITSDTSVAHLAGGMGQKTWLLLKKIPEWRWGIDGETTFWYPSMRLFRQTQRDNWDDVMTQVTSALRHAMAIRKTHRSAPEAP